MRCETCQGTGKRRELSSAFHRYLACGDCGGSGIAHCCDGERPTILPAPVKSKTTREGWRRAFRTSDRRRRRMEGLFYFSSPIPNSEIKELLAAGMVSSGLPNRCCLILAVLTFPILLDGCHWNS